MNILFVCSQGRLRSKTAAHALYVNENENRYAGTNSDTDVPLTKELVDWADKIICMEQEHRTKVRRRFKGNSHKIMVWGFRDIYGYMDDVLVALLRGKYREFFDENYYK